MVRLLAPLAVMAVAVTFLAGPAPAGVGPIPSGPPPSATSALAAVESRFLTTRPPVGPTHVVHIGGESAGRTLTARTLQGLVNRTAARLYLIDAGDPGAQVLLDRYVDRGLVTITATTGLDAALDGFASEVNGYVLADPDEPWSVHGATVIAGLEGGVVATEGQVVELQARGLTELDDTRGRWPDAVTAYRALAATYRDQLASDTVAVVRPSNTLWDFVLQQGILPIFTRPSDPSWGAMQSILADVPEGLPVYGYLSDTGEEEAIALAALASHDLTLVPTDTTRNLSFHIAVGADQPRVPMPQPDLTSVDPCTTDSVNVVVGLTDGDNMNVPLNHFLRPTNWDSPNRGDLPLGWSIGPDLAVLAPAAWDGYALEATGRDELVAMIGWSYGAPALLSDPADFYRTSFALMDELGMRTFWSLGGGLETPLSSYWEAFDEAAGEGVPDGVLVGYGNATGSAFYSPAGRPAFTSRSVYSETPAQLAQHVADLQATPADQRPLVSFLSATNWSNPAGTLIDALVPFRDRGVRFLTPAEATACMPPAPEPPPPVGPTPDTCLPREPVTQHGLPLISDPTANEVTRTPTAFTLPATVVATPSVAPGETIDYSATITVDMAEFARRTLDERVRPVIEAGYGPELADSAWLTLAVDHLSVPFPAPSGTTPTGTPTIVSTGADASVAWTADTLSIDLASIGADTRTPEGPFELRVSWSAIAGDTSAPVDVTLHSGPVTFDLTLDIGVVLGTVPLTGGIAAAWDCLADPAALARTAVVPPVIQPEPPDPPDGPDAPAGPSVPSVPTTTPDPADPPDASVQPVRRAEPANPLSARATFSG